MNYQLGIKIFKHFSLIFLLPPYFYHSVEIRITFHRNNFSKLPGYLCKNCISCDIDDAGTLETMVENDRKSQNGGAGKSCRYSQGDLITYPNFPLPRQDGVLRFYQPEFLVCFHMKLHIYPFGRIYLFTVSGFTFRFYQWVLHTIDL